MAEANKKNWILSLMDISEDRLPLPPMLIGGGILLEGTLLLFAGNQKAMAFEGRLTKQGEQLGEAA